MSNPRDKLLARLKRRLERVESPRLHLFLMMLLAGVFGAVCSFGLLRVGLEQMWLRYPIAAALGYLVFIVALRIWAGEVAKDLAADPDFAELEAAGEPPAEASSASPAPQPARELDLDFNLLDLLDFPSDDDFVAWALMLLLLALATTLAAVLVSASVLLAEAVLDGLLVAGLWRRFMRSAQTESIWGAAKATLGPAALVIVCLSAIGYLLQVIDPTAKSIGDLFR